MIFLNRSEAGRLLAERLVELELGDPIVYALPRGGVPVAVEIARMLAAPLDLLIVRKIGAPGFPELALGAVVGGAAPQLIVNDDVYAATGSDAANLERTRRNELDEIARRRGQYLGDRPIQDPVGRVAIVVDDGIATGATARAALAALRVLGARMTVLAAPVAPARTLKSLKSEVDMIAVLHAPDEFWAIGQFYRDFHQLSDQETINYLRTTWDTE